MSRVLNNPLTQGMRHPAGMRAPTTKDYYAYPEYVTVNLSRGDARDLVTHLEETFTQSDKPMRVAWIAEEIATALGEKRPYPKMPKP